MKYMTMKDFYKLAKKNKACKEGLTYLKGWMDEHPKAKSVKTFFNNHKHINKSHIKLFHCNNLFYSDWYIEISIECYFRWIAYNLIDYSNIGQKDLWLKKYYKTPYIGTASHETIILLLISSFNEEGEE